MGASVSVVRGRPEAGGWVQWVMSMLLWEGVLVVDGWVYREVAPGVGSVGDEHAVTGKRPRRRWGSSLGWW